MRSLVVTLTGRLQLQDHLAFATASAFIAVNALRKQNRAAMQTAPAAHARPVQSYAVLERYIVSCYAAEGWFAVSINLNSESEGGEVSFPEYGPRSFKPPPGGAVVFSCSILHAVSKVTSGRRYAFLPFLYDDSAAKLREQNNAHLAEGVSAYRF